MTIQNPGIKRIKKQESKSSKVNMKGKNNGLNKK